MTTEEINALIQAEVTKALQAQATAQLQADPASAVFNPAPASQAAAPTPIKVNVGGQMLEYSSADQLSAALNSTLSDFGRQRQELEARLAAATQQGAQTTRDEAPVDTFSQEDFIKNMTDDPRKGLNYALNHLLFEGKSADASAQLRQRLGAADTTDRALAAFQFKEQHPEYPGGEQIANVVEQVRQSLNMPYNANSLDAAYSIAIQRGQIPNFPELYRQAEAYKAGQHVDASGYPENPGPDPRQYTGGAPVPYQPNITAGIQHDPRTFNGGSGITPAPAQAFQNNLAQNPYLRGVPGIGRGGNAPQIDYAAAGEQLSIEQIENIFAKSGR